jgi:Arc/MetJ-type ribon-helix-helix transcriptional regulator
MPRLTITISEDQSELLEELSGEAGEYDSKSEAVREFIQAGERQVELQAQVDELRERVQSRENRIKDLESQLRERSQVETKIDNLPDRIQSNETYQERRQRLLDKASVPTRIKWTIMGVPVEENDS